MLGVERSVLAEEEAEEWLMADTVERHVGMGEGTAKHRGRATSGAGSPGICLPASLLTPLCFGEQNNNNSD